MVSELSEPQTYNLSFVGVWKYKEHFMVRGSGSFYTHYTQRRVTPSL